MNYKKIDAALAMAIDEVDTSEQPSLIVFIHTNQPLEAPAITFLESLGIKDVASDKDIYTATVSSGTVSQLSHQPWVKSIKLSQKLRLMKVGN
ncbi:hypothetical protein CAL7716_062260 [Calothrix sp. PCC 7716]|nr:hypothetical protein CAL7716_062260 [Calothrix sp. PCC 7716]